MRNLHATYGRNFGSRNIVRLLVAASCLSSQTYAAEGIQEAPKQQNVGITFKNGKVELPPAALPPLPSVPAAADTKPNELPSLASISELPSLPVGQPVTKDAPKLELPPPPLPAFLTEPSPAIAGEAPASSPKPQNAVPSMAAEAQPAAAGKVTVKLGDNAAGVSKSDSSSSPIANAPKASPVRLTDSNSQNQNSGNAANGIAGSTSPMKFSLDDNGVIEHAVKTNANPPVLQQRAPELVRPARGSSSKIVALPVAKDPGRQMDRASEMPAMETAFPNIVSAPEIPGSTSRSLSQLTSQSSAQGIGVNARMDLPAPTGQIALPAGGASASVGYPATSMRMASDVSQDRVFDIEVLGTINMVMPANVTSASSRNADICSVFHNGSTLTIVGNMPGRTSVEVQTTSGQRRMLTFKVVPAGTQHAGPSKDLERVMQMVTQHFPGSQVSFSQDASGSVTLKGTASNEAEARKILELVRKVCLVPVDDKIFVAR